MTIRKYSDRYWAVYDEADVLICVTLYKKDVEVVRRLTVALGRKR
ncbi:hypothetical protein EV210_106284 [Anaerospora hongkongensis]|uniref:ParE-like toxin of type II ParDE toxin-antitoxin system n=1 Tax=Anaerospora hongkongensis TaxID=244830 RepID=A0A4R1Q1P5_9FIRM|nr:hypothetical protein [Anaerospora hongkongensis]TCL37415.1 hypothetical protein EV210_106284 [Anaerospora hongkongensis]